MSGRVLTPAEEVAAGSMEAMGMSGGKREGTPLHAAAEAAVAADKPRKPRKRRRDRVHVHYYRNLNKPLAGDAGVPVVVGRDVEKRDFSAADRRRLAAEGKALPNGSFPIETVEDLGNAAHLAASGHGDVEAARRLIARRARELGVANPMNRDHVAVPKVATSLAETDFRSPFNRLSESRVNPGAHASVSTGDHNVGAGYSRELAYMHPALRQSSTTVRPFSNVEGNGPVFAGQVAFGGMCGPSRVAVQLLDATMGAGTYAGISSGRSGDPGRRGNAIQYEPARGSATPPNGSHSTGTPACPPTGAMKGSDALRIMRDHMRRAG